jgi:hypothetical protein
MIRTNSFGATLAAYLAGLAGTFCINAIEIYKEARRLEQLAIQYVQRNPTCSSETHTSIMSGERDGKIDRQV